MPFFNDLLNREKFLNVASESLINIIRSYLNAQGLSTLVKSIHTVSTSDVIELLINPRFLVLFLYRVIINNKTAESIRVSKSGG